MQDRPDTLTTLAPDLHRILAQNPSPMTYWGTNTFLLGDGSERVLIDPGPDLPSHLDAIMAALHSGTRISHILVTHAHLDHTAGTDALKSRTGAEVYAFGDAHAGRSAIMQTLHESGTLGGGEGVDPSFAPDILLADMETLETPAGPITALHTPGHMGNHLSFQWGDTIFVGDLVMAWSSSLISPPDGDAAAFRESCEKLIARAPARLLPAHGDAIDTPEERIRFLLTHRANREAQILAALSQTPQTLEALTRRVYHDLPESHLPAAARNTLAHLIDLVTRNEVNATPEISDSAYFSIP
ncbi:MBL fold metallo-hydrolase [Celeribacter litoreus]|uniref:MBL fold metallo-hydrolase n=1 Tax=Celeribacter litoreus TaxID=2876714 RepID=UPI001CCB4C1F|nr:MBL fold metallo-hydrolase [Celeribacter litoreus]MCA0043721.1 MBL fold metallo-hydrolase [Celeribacter litoreus]